MTLLKILLIFLSISFVAYATMYEDAEDKKTSRWRLINSQSSNSINNIRDLKKKSRIIEFQGEGTRYAYELKTKKKKKNEYWLSWQMKFSEDFVIIVILNTNIGEDYLIYTPGIFKSYKQYALGHASSNGKWQTFSRNLQKDIAYFDNRIKIVSLKSFVLKGNGKIDNIMTQRVNLLKEKKLVKQKKQKKVLKKSTNNLPVLSVLGAQTVLLSIGDKYVEEGASAYDKEDGEINVVSMENIDTNVNGRYMVLYMVTDSDGNMALDKRYVHVGDIQIKETSVNLESDETKEIEEEYSDEKIDFSKNQEQIRIWEKELALREKELAQREKKSNEN